MSQNTWLFSGSPVPEEPNVNNRSVVATGSKSGADLWGVLLDERILGNDVVKVANAGTLALEGDVLLHRPRPVFESVGLGGVGS